VPTLRQINLCNTQGEAMLVRKVRGQDKIGKVIMSQSEMDSVKKLGVPIEVYVKQMLLIIAKKRRWKWYPNKGTP
jgi:sensor histidine kinase regulating citrate/malate metabolism